MKPPTEPDKQDCCNSGCNPCIFDVYDKQLALYKKFQETGVDSSSNISEQNAITRTSYTTFVLIDSKELCESHKILFFTLKSHGADKVFWKPGDHFLIKYMSENHSCTRAYTPMKLKLHNTPNFDFSIIVKSYLDGLVSNYLSNLKCGEETLWRGPYGPYDINSNKFNRLIMIAQGTGIAPFISIIEHILDNEEDITRINLNYCCQTLDKILFREHLYSLKSYWNFTYKVFVNTTMESSCKYNEPIKFHKLTFDEFSNLKPFTQSDQFLLCGSTNFMKEFEQWLKVNEQFDGSIILF